MNKILGIIMAMLAVFSASVMAVQDYAIQTVYLNGYQISGNTVQVELGQHVTLDVAVYGNVNKDNLRVRAWIGGYEYDVVEDESEMFDVEKGVMEWKKLSFDVPEDMVSGKTYTLNLQIFDANNEVNRQYNLYVEAERHNIVVQDVILNPNTALESGDTFFAKVRLENMGEKKEEDIRVDLVIESLGISTRTYLDELPKYMADENSANTQTLSLTIPENAATGDYKVKAVVTYNRGHSETVEEFMIRVNGVSANDVKSTDSMISVQSVKDMNLNEETLVKVMVANMGKKTKVYSIEAAGLSWADSSLSSFISVAPGQTGELIVKVTPNEAGSHAFSIKVREDNSLVKESSFNVNVADGKKNDSLFWLIAAGLVFVVVIAVIASSLFGEKVEHKELQHEF